MIELRDLELLSALARHGHFAKAAAECGISQPAFSMRVSKLEARLGVTIVRRANRFQGLTEEGDLIVARARRILDGARALEQEITSARGEIRGTLRLGVVPTSAAYAARLSIRLRQMHPGIVTRIETTSSVAIQRRLDDGTIDAGVTYDDSIGRDLVSVEYLYEESYVLLVPEALVARDVAQLTWREAAKLPLSLLEPQMQNRRILDRVFEDQGLSPMIVAETNGFTASIVMAREGQTATVVPDVLIDGLGELGATRVLPLIEPEFSKVICLAVRERQPELPVIAALRDAIATLHDNQ